MGNYHCKKDHNTFSCDVAFAGICNAMNTSTIVHQAQAERNFHEIRHPPGHPSTAANHEIHLVRVGQDAVAHYSTLIQAAAQSDIVDPDSPNQTLHFSL